jgi:hypothetical protein
MVRRRVAGPRTHYRRRRVDAAVPVARTHDSFGAGAVFVDLRDAGRALWDAVHADLGAEWRFDARELAVLEAACKQADLVADLEAAVGRDGLTVLGASGQPRLNGAVTELRQGRVALARLLGDIRLPNEDGNASTVTTERARRAAEARWSRDRRVAG